MLHRSKTWSLKEKMNWHCIGEKCKWLYGSTVWLELVYDEGSGLE